MRSRLVALSKSLAHRYVFESPDPARGRHSVHRSLTSPSAVRPIARVVLQSRTHSPPKVACRRRPRPPRTALWGGTPSVPCLSCQSGQKTHTAARVQCVRPSQEHLDVDSGRGMAVRLAPFRSKAHREMPARAPAEAEIQLSGVELYLDQDNLTRVARVSPPGGSPSDPSTPKGPQAYRAPGAGERSFT